MKKGTLVVLAVLVLLASISFAQAPPAPPVEAQHVLVDAAALKWMDGPPGLPKGAKFAVVSGDPGATGSFVIRAKLPANYKIAPHWHPTDEHVTVLSGTLAMGMGETFDKAKMHTLAAGGYGKMPADHRHYAFSKGGATIQIHAQGPFAITYVNAADDPRNAAPAK